MNKQTHHSTAARGRLSVVGRSPDRHTRPTAGLKAYDRRQETFGRARGRVGRPAHNLGGAGPDRRGSTIIVVLALLGALMLLGFLVYTIAAQNQVSSTYFADAAKVQQARIDPNILCDNVLRQIILGPDDGERNSALWGGDKSLLATLFGRDLQPYTGRGIHLGWNSGTNRPFVDQNFDNAADADQSLLEINKSPAAQGTVLDLINRPDPDVDYTAPDINSPFLSYDGLVPNGAGTPVRVIIPSFHRPQILRNVAAVGDWYTDPATARRVLRPHVEHRAIADDGTVTAIRRFVSVTHPDPAAPPLKLNPFPFAIGAGVQEGVWSETPGTIAYDVDLDGDGIKEAVYLDYGFPMLTSPDGTSTFVPMAAVTIKCADSRLNLSAHGNIYGDVTQTNVPFGGQVSGQTQFISKSDTGYGFWEVNPQYGLRGIPNLTNFTGTTQAELDAALEPHRIAFRTNPNNPSAMANNPQNAKELSNMEWWFLLTGRADFLSGGTRSDITVLHTGRWGETSRLKAGIASRVASDFPGPGTSSPVPPIASISGGTFNPSFPAHFGADDNKNLAESGPFQAGGQLYPSTVLNTSGASIPFAFPAFRHPIDLRGSGRRTTPGTFGRQVDLFQPGRMSYARYRNYFVHPGLGYLTDNSAQGNFLLLSGTAGYQVDEPGETIYDPSAPTSQTITDDSLFGPEENASLELPTAVLSQLGKPGRVLALAPYNFWASNQAQEIRRLFTATGWDLKSHGQTFYGVYPPGLPYPPGVPSIDTDYTGAPNTRLRRWEWTADTDGDGNVEFPPWFAGTILPATQPFRAVLRNLLTVEVRSPGIVGVPVKTPQRKFSINGVLDRNPTTGRLFFRPLTPHPAGLDRDRISTRLSNPSNPLTRPAQIGNVYDQEYLARRDRQLMCRDIYVMLYTFCGSSRNSVGTYLNYTGDNAGQLLYSFDPNDGLGRGDQLKQIAQFAVNLVDSLDPDDNITLFEYDKNLGNGWNLDDNPYTDGEPVTERGVVAGVEAQTLCFNEALATFAKKVLQAGAGFNHSATEYNDTDNRDFLHIELQNISSRTISFANSAWQIVVRPVNDASSVTPIAGMEERRLTLTSAAPGIGTGAAPSSLYTIGTSGDNQNVDGSGNIRPSFINVNIWYQHPMNDMGTFTRIVPRGGLNLDLMTAPTSYYDVVRKQPSGNFGDGSRFPSTTSAPSGAELLELGPNKGSIDGSSFINVELELRRRADLRRAPPILFDAGPANHIVQSKDNPWVVVDKLTVRLRVMSLQDTDNYVQLQSAHLQRLASRERLRALHGATNGLNDGLINASFQRNSLGQINNSGGGPIPAAQAPLWHPHYDRDFTSVAELFDVPLYGPDELTQKIAALTGSGSARRIFLRGDSTAGAKFLQPRGGLVGSVTGATVDDNLWYRLLGLVEVPTRADRHFETPSYTIDAGRIGGSNPLGIFRVPGRIQLNMLAHPEVLMGLLDDRDVVDMPLPTNAFPYLTDQFSEAGRDWWAQFLRARDGIDPISGLSLSGVPGISKPFRSLSFAAREQNSVQNTILRALPKDVVSLGGADNARELFEIGTLSEHRSAVSGTQAIDYSNRHRLLGKVLDNSSTRSNVFLVYIQVDYFSAREVTDSGTGKKVVRIGAKLGNSPAYRSFYVIDRSKAVDLIDPTKDLPTVDPNTGRFLYTFKRSLDYRALILHQQRIQ